jgi:hypothetical protein
MGSRNGDGARPAPDAIVLVGSTPEVTQVHDFEQARTPRVRDPSGTEDLMGYRQPAPPAADERSLSEHVLNAGLKVAMWISGAFVALVVMLYGFVWFTTVYTTEEHLGPGHALVGKDDAWIFLEIRTFLRNGCPLASPNGFNNHYRHVVVHVTPPRTNTIPMGRPYDVNFHQLTRAFRHSGKLYVYDPPIAARSDSLFEWRGDRFELLPLDRSGRTGAGLGLTDQNPSERSARIDRLCRTDGYELVGLSSLEYSREVHFSWGTDALTLEKVDVSDKRAEVRLTGTRAGRDLNATVVTFDPSRHPSDAPWQKSRRKGARAADI